MRVNGDRCSGMSLRLVAKKGGISRAGLFARCGPAPFTGHCYGLLTTVEPPLLAGCLIAFTIKANGFASDTRKGCVASR